MTADLGVNEGAVWKWVSFTLETDENNRIIGVFEDFCASFTKSRVWVLKR